MIALKPEKLIAAIEEAKSSTKIKYDLHEALKYSIDLEYGEKHKVETYLYEKIGEVEKCITSFLKDLEEIMWTYIESYEQTEVEGK